MTIHQINFTGAGFNENNRCIYAIIIKNDTKKYIYIGITGSSNRSGLAYPFKRLATHLNKSSNTKSVFFNNNKLPVLEITNETIIKYIYMFADNVEEYEKYILSVLKNKQIHNLTILNKKIKNSRLTNVLKDCEAFISEIYLNIY